MYCLENDEYNRYVLSVNNEYNRCVVKVSLPMYCRSWVTSSPVEFELKSGSARKKLDKLKLYTFRYRILSAFQRSTVSKRIFWGKKVTAINVDHR